jgi:hypothetical protein
MSLDEGLEGGTIKLNLPQLKEEKYHTPAGWI